MKSLVQRLTRVLDNSTGERKICQLIKERPELVLWSFVTTGGHSKYVVSEFRFGANYRADFVVPFSYSGVWEVHFVELEPPSDCVFTKNGRPSKRLNAAISQIGDWREFVERNQALVRQDLSDCCVKRDLLGWHTNGKPPFNYTGDYLRDPTTFIKFEYHIIIGRRANVSQETRRRMNQFRHHDFLEICTYDRLIDIAQNLDDSDRKTKPSVYLPRTADRESPLWAGPDP